MHIKLWSVINKRCCRFLVCTAHICANMRRQETCDSRVSANFASFTYMQHDTTTDMSRLQQSYAANHTAMTTYHSTTQYRMLLAYKTTWCRIQFCFRLWLSRIDRRLHSTANNTISESAFCTATVKTAMLQTWHTVIELLNNDFTLYC